ncbi:MAG: Methyltransferase type 11 [Phycisphaerales bacterium]|nr:Methyltransferase type 11 [Phycisphaerales bacterium]
MNCLLPLFRSSPLSARVRTAEWMDDPAADPAELERSLVFIRRVNAWLGYTRATLGHLARFARGWERGRPIRVLDVATGSADVPLAVLAWARQVGHDVRVVGLDLHDKTVAAARRAAAAAGVPAAKLSVVRADATALPFAAGAFDYAMTSMFLHHLDDDVAVRVLAEMNRVAARGILAADLLRSRRAYAWISLFTAAANPMVRHDARASVAQAFTRAEIEAVRDRAGVPYARYHAHFGHRFVLAGEKVSHG